MFDIEEYGFLTPKADVATDSQQAVNLAQRIGFPVALKILSPDILHKTDVGGVELDLHSEEEVEAAFQRIMRSVKGRCPQARIDGVSVEEMCVGGQEIIIGLLNDAQFGPSIMFGLGGLFVEVVEDVSFRVLPISKKDAEEMMGEIKGRKILEGYRGFPPVSREMVVELLLKAAQMGMDLASRLESVDFNPIMVWDREHRVLDVKILLSKEEKPVVEGNPNTAYLGIFFEARSVALVGASATSGKIGNAVLDSLANHQYEGKIYPINPAREEVLGLKAYPSLSAVPEPVELVVVTVALSLVPEILGECASKAVHNVVIVSGGGKELGGESEELEAAIKHLAKANDLRIIGPNCIGVFDGETRLDTFFQVHERMVRPRKGPIAMLTQSGTVGAAFLEAGRDVGVSRFVSFGNRIDVDEADLIAYLADDPSTKVIACYIEGFGDGRKFLSTARKVSEKKPIVVFKAGRSRQAARASISHTGFFGGTYGVSEGAFKQAGLIAVDSSEELYAVAKVLALQPHPRGARIAMISNGAGTMVQAMDLLEEYGVKMMPLARESIAILEKAYPPYYLVQNPVDVTGSATSADYEIGIKALLEDPNVDIVMPWFVFQDTPLGEDIVNIIGRLSQKYDKPILCGATGGAYTERMSRALEAQGVPVCNSVRDWMATAGGLAQWRARMKRSAAT